MCVECVCVCSVCLWHLIDALGGKQTQHIVRHEVAHSVLLSETVKRGVCANFIEIFDVFLCAERPHEPFWGSAANRKPHGDTHLLGVEQLERHVEVGGEKKRTRASLTTCFCVFLGGKELHLTCPAPQPPSPSPSTGSLYQYIQMEYCDGGDLEHFTTLQEHRVLPVGDAVLPFLFQMVFSIYCARERLQLRHWDVKVRPFGFCLALVWLGHF